MIRVLFVGEDMERGTGGVVSVMQLICKHPYLADKVQFEPIYAALQPDSLGNKVIRWIRSFFKLLFALPQSDIVHLHHTIGNNFIGTSLFALVSKLFGKQVLLHNHAADFDDYYAEASRSLKWWVRSVFRRADLILIMSQSWRHWYEKIEPAANWQVAHNAASQHPTLRFFESRNPEALKFIYLSRLEQRKGVYDLLHVLEQVVPRYPSLQVVLAGDGDLADVRQAVAVKNLKHCVTIPGYVTTEMKCDIFQDASVFLLPSYQEGLPMALLETMALGIAPLVTPVGGIPEVIQNDVNGLLIPAGDLERLETALCRLIDDTALRNRLGRAAHETIAKDFSQDVYVEILFEMYADLLRSEQL